MKLLLPRSVQSSGYMATFKRSVTTFSILIWYHTLLPEIFNCVMRKQPENIFLHAHINLYRTVVLLLPLIERKIKMIKL